MLSFTTGFFVSRILARCCEPQAEKLDQFFPKVKVKLSSNDPAFISPRVKLLLNKRRILIRKGMVLEADSLQVTIDNLIQQNQMNGARSIKKKQIL